MPDDLKFCNTCEETKPLSEFGNSSKAKDGKRTQCKQCERDYRERTKEDRKEYQRIYRTENADAIRVNQRRWQQDNPDKVAAYAKDYRERYPDRVRESGKQWRENHPDRAKDAERKTDYNRRTRRAEHYASNREFRLAQNQAWKDRSADKISEYNRAYHQDHLIEGKARRAVRKAVLDGRLIRPSVCQRCHQPSSEIIGHHHSYEPEYWLDVEWLCKKCHLRHHAEEKYADQAGT